MERSILCWLRMNFKAFPPELRANLSGNHGRNRKCSFSQIRNLLKTNTSRISGLPKKWQTGGREKCLSAAELIEFLKVWLIRIPRFCVDDSDSVPILPLPIIFFCTIGPGSFILFTSYMTFVLPTHNQVSWGTWLGWVRLFGASAGFPPRKRA